MTIRFLCTLHQVLTSCSWSFWVMGFGFQHLLLAAAVGGESPWKLSQNLLMKVLLLLVIFLDNTHMRILRIQNSFFLVNLVLHVLLPFPLYLLANFFGSWINIDCCKGQDPFSLTPAQALRTEFCRFSFGFLVMITNCFAKSSDVWRFLHLSFNLNVVGTSADGSS